MLSRHRISMLCVAMAAACATPGQRAAHTAPAAQTAGPASAPAASPGISARARRIFEEANTRYEKQRKAGNVDYDGLAQRYREAAADSPSFAEAEYDLGVLLQRQGRLDDAASAYQEALRRNPALAAAQVNLASIDRLRGQVDQAVQLLEAAVKGQPSNASAWAELADVDLERGDGDRAKTLAKAALARDPKSALAYRVLLEQSLAAGDDDMTKLLALKASKVDPKDPAIPYALGKLALKKKKIQAAVAQLKAALDLDRGYEPALVELARVAFDHQDYAAAEQSYRHLIQGDPKDCAAHVDLGVAERALGHLDAAESEYGAALRCDPRLTVAYYDLGLLYHRQKNDCGKAIELYRSFISKGSEPPPGNHPVFAALQECQQLEAMAAQQREQEAKKPSPSPPAAPAPAPGSTPGASPSKPPAAGAGEAASQPGAGSSPAPAPRGPPSGSGVTPTEADAGAAAPDPAEPSL
ncbi:MAG: adventurous gliding motility TPR repeat lipoprotein GltE [Myxococcales bacterium]